MQYNCVYKVSVQYTYTCVWSESSVQYTYVHMCMVQVKCSVCVHMCMVQVKCSVYLCRSLMVKLIDCGMCVVTVSCIRTDGCLKYGTCVSTSFGDAGCSVWMFVHKQRIQSRCVWAGAKGKSEHDFSSWFYWATFVILRGVVTCNIMLPSFGLPGDDSYLRPTVAP